MVLHEAAAHLRANPHLLAESYLGGAIS